MPDAIRRTSKVMSGAHKGPKTVKSTGPSEPSKYRGNKAGQYEQTAHGYTKLNKI